MGETSPNRHLSMKLFLNRISRGFTLVELLVVMTIIGVMLTLASTVLRNTGTGRTLDSGLDMVVNLIREARATAIGNDTYTRLIIATDPSDNSKDSRHLRYMAVQMLRRADTKYDGTSVSMEGDWVSVSSGVLLPPGVFFSPTYSHALSWAEGSGDRIGTDTAKLTRYTRSKVYYIEFDEKGRYVSPTAGPTSATQPQRIVLINARIGKGRNAHDGLVPLQVDSQRRPVGAKGIVIWPAGNTSELRTREQIFNR